MTYDRGRSRLRYEHKKAVKAKADKKWEALSFRLVNPEFYRFSRDVRIHAEGLLRYMQSAWCKKTEAEKDALIREMLPSDAPFLAANNPEARILFYRAWKCNVGAFEFAGPSHLVTLTPKRYVKSLEEAKAFDIFSLMSWARAELQGFDCVGIVEIACYTNTAGQPVLGAKNDPVIAFHVHIVVSNADEGELGEVMDRINGKDDALVEGCPAADMRLIKPGTLPTVLRYLAKGPTGDYRVYPMKREEMDDETGELTDVMTGRFRQRSKLAAKKLQLRIREITASYHLDEMIFATGKGVATLKAVRRDALRDLPWSMRSGRQFKFSGQLPELAMPARHVLGSWVNIDGFVREEATARARAAYQLRRRRGKTAGATSL
jgi:hypothetical protein